MCRQRKETTFGQRFTIGQLIRYVAGHMPAEVSLFCLIAATIGLIGSERAQAIPRFSLLTGTRCSACHFNPQGGGIRQELGWMSMNEVGALSLEEVGLGGLKSETNSYFNNVFTVGLDARGQLAKLGRPPEAKRMFIPMQLAAHAAVVPFEGLSAYGSYNFSTLRYSFQGQTPWTAAIQYQPSVQAPSIRAGYIQPSIGIRHDDHTLFIRKDAAHNNTPVVPPEYNELGAELTFEGLRLLTLNTGVFGAKNLAKVEPTIDENSVSYTARVMLWPQLLDDGINGMAGGSILANGDYTLLHIFGGFGLADKATFYGEGMFSDNVNDKRMRNYSAQATWQLKEWLALAMRYEWGQTEIPPSDLYHSSAFVIGAEFFPIPYLELRPEYRYFENDIYRQGQYTLQVHLFY